MRLIYYQLYNHMASINHLFFVRFVTVIYAVTRLTLLCLGLGVSYLFRWLFQTSEFYILCCLLIVCLIRLNIQFPGFLGIRHPSCLMVPLQNILYDVGICAKYALHTTGFTSSVIFLTFSTTYCVFFSAKKCYPHTRCIKKIANQPCYN